MTEKTKTFGIKSWPQDDRPREKLLKKGAGALSNSELLAILLRTGVQGTSAIDPARRILDKFGTFRNMTQTDRREWRQFKFLFHLFQSSIIIGKLLEMIGGYFQRPHPVACVLQLHLNAHQQLVQVVFGDLLTISPHAFQALLVILNVDAEFLLDGLAIFSKGLIFPGGLSR